MIHYYNYSARNSELSGLRGQEQSLRCIPVLLSSRNCLKKIFELNYRNRVDIKNVKYVKRHCVLAKKTTTQTYKT